MTEPAPQSKRVWWIIGLAFVLAWIIYLWVFPPGPRPPSPGAPADFQWKLLDLNDKPVPFSKFKGKTIFLNIWATWCGPCVREMPSIAALAANPRLKDVAFVCASVDDSSETVREFLRGKNWSMTFLRATNRPPAYQTNGIPATFLIRPDGTLISSEVGATDWDTDENVDLLEHLARSAAQP